MRILNEILETLPEGDTVDVRIGLHWTAVVVRAQNELRCGLASTLREAHDHGPEADVPEAGRLLTCPALELARLAVHPKPTLASIGMAALNALLPRQGAYRSEENAETILAQRGKNRRVALIGRFPFATRLKGKVGELSVLEQQPGPDDLPAELAPEVLPRADVVAITGMTFANKTFMAMLELCSPDAFVMVLGPSTPLTPILFKYGVDLISGSLVTAIEPVLRTLSEGGNFRQLHAAGVSLANMVRDGVEL